MTSVNASDTLSQSSRQPTQQTTPLTGSYHSTVRKGRKLMAEARVVLCGLARNVAQVLPQTRARMERTGAMFGDYRIFLYENDSHDRTGQLLADWQAANSRMTFRSDDLGRQQHPSIRCVNRAADMADYRNRCQQEVAERWSDFDFVCVIDTDLIGGWSDDGLAHSFGSQPWDFVGSYGTILRRRHLQLKALHYDVWAYREFGDYAPIDGRTGNAMSWNCGEPLVPVYSCFGGLGVYRLPAWLSARYTGEDCEHVTLHRGLRVAGYGRQFLNPNQRTCYGRKSRRFDSVLLPLGSAIHSTAALFAF